MVLRRSCSLSGRGFTVNVLDLAQTKGHYKKVSSNKGGEYHGPCPICGGNDRFHIWPAQKVTGDWWCRGCDRGGDLIQWFIDVEGMTFPEACKAVGRELPELREGQTPQTKRPAGDNWQPNTPAAPAELWQEHAGKLVEWAHQQLLALGEGPGTPLHYLAARGIRKESAIAHRLGWNPGEKGKDLYRTRKAWGLEAIIRDGKEKKLWLPIGLVIPFYAGGRLRRIRIRIPSERRTPEFSTPYYVVPGSSMDTYVVNPGAKAFVIVEAELDGILVGQEVAELNVGAMALGNNSAKPTDGAYALLQSALHISVALDYDLEPGSTENPGGKSSTWWSEHFSHAERWPVPAGKDPGDAFKAGYSIREWVLLNLPPIFSLSQIPAAPAPCPRETAPAAPVSRVPVFDSGKAGQMIRDAYSLIAGKYQEGALEWVKASRPDLWARIQAAEAVTDCAMQSEDPGKFKDAVQEWQAVHLEAWEAFESRPPIVEVQGGLFAAVPEKTYRSDQ